MEMDITDTTDLHTAIPPEEILHMHWVLDMHMHSGPSLPALLPIVGIVPKLDVFLKSNILMTSYELVLAPFAVEERSLSSSGLASIAGGGHVDVRIIIYCPCIAMMLTMSSLTVCSYVRKYSKRSYMVHLFS